MRPPARGDPRTALEQMRPPARRAGRAVAFGPVTAPTRQSQLVLPTEKRPPADAEALSHKLMVRAGLVRQVGAGLWTWLPAGWRVHQNVVQIVREEMDAIGCQEMLMPEITPAG